MPQAQRSVARTPLVLASASPRRRRLLADAGLAFEGVPASIDEKPRPGEAPDDLAARLAREKAQAVARRLGSGPRRVVLGSDTVVIRCGESLGKPLDAEHAVATLRRLVGAAHEVVTAVAAVESDSGRVHARSVRSRVLMRAADDAEIRAYVATGEPMDKAGAYAVQGEGRRFVLRVEGSETNVIGLPLEETLSLLRELGVEGAEP